MTLSSVHDFVVAHQKTELGTFLRYLLPFKGRKRVRRDGANEFPTEDAMSWLPNHNDHGKWITDIVCHLLNLKASYDDLLQLLVPICKVKVHLPSVFRNFYIFATLFYYT